ncbi:hypothetical protein GCM10010331_74550 [Streptomyces xanthochromogenes]|nr:hypothetical protein GCM10010331_74550 [Streptomyces xanthochromogenes]
MSTTRRPLGTGPQSPAPALNTALPRHGTVADRATGQPPPIPDRELATRDKRRPLGPGADCTE